MFKLHDMSLYVKVVQPNIYYRYGEVMVGIFFVILALLWLLREPKFVRGWSSVFSTDANNQRYGYIHVSIDYCKHVRAEIIVIGFKGLDTLKSSFSMMFALQPSNRLTSTTLVGKSKVLGT